MLLQTQAGVPDIRQAEHLALFTVLSPHSDNLGFCTGISGRKREGAETSNRREITKKYELKPTTN